MGWGVLDDKYMENPPGTAKLTDNNQSSGIIACYRSPFFQKPTNAELLVQKMMRTPTILNATRASFFNHSLVTVSIAMLLCNIVANGSLDPNDPLNWYFPFKFLFFVRS